MFKVTEGARIELEKFFADHPRGAVRVYLAPGRTGQHLALVMDEPDEEEDAVFTVEGYTFCIHKNALAKVGGVLLDVEDGEFVPRPEIPLPTLKLSGCASCAGRSRGTCGSCSEIGKH